MRSMPQNLRWTRRHQGFTLIEILMVVIIMGIAGMLVVPQMLNAGSLTIQGAARMIISDVLVAQNEAIAQGQSCKVIFDVQNNQYRLTDIDGAVLEMAWMDQNYVVDFSQDPRFNDVTIISADFNGSNEVIFDDLGSPETGGTVIIGSGDNQYLITIADLTGRVSVQPIEGL